MLLPPFCVLRDGSPIEAAPLRHTIRTGIKPNDVRLDLGMISEYEEREAAVFAHTSWQEWLVTDLRERAATVAHMRYHYLISAHTSDAVATEQERRAKSRTQGGHRGA